MNNPVLLSGAVYELRSPRGRQGTISGYFETAAALYAASEAYDGKVPGLYVTLNPVNRALLARAKNRLNAAAKSTTSDADIVRRMWLLLDCDAVRPADISSTDAEHQAALDRAIHIADWLTAQGWPQPVRADSGNGAHLLYRIDLPNDAAARDLVKAILEVVALRFNDAVVTIDTSVSNAARITKLYGTLVCKGDSTEDRPHRRSTILSTPDVVAAVSLEQLQGLAALRPADPKPTYQPVTGTRFDLQEFMRRHSLTVAREKSWNGATVYELEHCPFNPEHTRDSSIIQFPTGGLSFQCFHNSCQGLHWKELRDHLEPDRPRRVSPYSHEPTAAPPAVEFQLVSANTVSMKPVKWTIQGRVPLGMLTVLAGRGGVGKSTVGCEWSAQITNGKAAGALAGHPSPVIISSTEDTESETLIPRLTAATADLAKIHFLRLQRGGIDGSLTIPNDIEILRQAVQQTMAKLIIIDPLMAHLDATLNGWNDQEIRRALTPLARLAEDCTVSVLVLAHLNKDSKKDAIDRIGGSVGISNTARSVLFAGADPDDPEGLVKMLAHPKCNVGPSAPTLRYRMEPIRLASGTDAIETTHIIWEGEAPGVTADDLMSKAEPLSQEAREQAVTWLAKILPVGARRQQTEIEAEATRTGVTVWALKKAKVLLNVKSRKTGFNPAVWWWSRDPAPYISAELSPSDKNTPKSLKNAKGSEGESPLPFDASSASEGERKIAHNFFDAPSHISITYKTLSPEGESQGSYREEVDLRAD